ncbi:hypothetical protein B0H14DRAFT_3421625 [Mycena olivaceomarginata]|nr:hypothetical protein B0H14DRAFT_3421625 [Mycena olivaceomarginata]
MLLDAPVIPFPRALLPPPQKSTPPAFYVANAGPSKGAGLFAACDIPAGGTILSDRPVAVVPSNVNAPWKREAFDALLPRISRISRDALLALANCKPLSEYPVVEGIALTNAIQVHLPVSSSAAPQEYGGVFPTCGLNTAVKGTSPRSPSPCTPSALFAAGEEIIFNMLACSPLVPNAAPNSRATASNACAHTAISPTRLPLRAATLYALNCATGAISTPFALVKDMCRADDDIIVSNLRALALVKQEGLYGMQVPFIEEIALSTRFWETSYGFVSGRSKWSTCALDRIPSGPQSLRMDGGTTILQRVGMEGETEAS